MSNLVITADQVFATISALMLLITSFRYLNNCNKDTLLIVRISLALFFTSSVGILLLVFGGNNIPWLFTANTFGIALYLLMNRRNYCSKSPQIRKELHN